MAELAAEAVRPTEEPAAQDDAAPDPDLTEDADEVVDPDCGAGPVLGECGEVRLVLDVDGKPEAPLELAGDGNAMPAEIRREHHGSRALLDEAGDGDGDADRAQLLACGRGERSPRSRAESVEHRSRRGATVVAVRAVLVADCSGEILEGDGDVVDVDLEADTDDDARELERLPGPSDTAGSAGLARLADEIELDELVDEAGDGAAREPRGRGNLGARARAHCGDPSKHDPEVGLPHRRLVGTGGPRSALEGKRCPDAVGPAVAVEVVRCQRVPLHRVCMEGDQTNPAVRRMSTDVDNCRVANAKEVAGSRRRPPCALRGQSSPALAGPPPPGGLIRVA